MHPLQSGGCRRGVGAALQQFVLLKCVIISCQLGVDPVSMEFTWMATIVHPKMGTAFGAMETREL